MGLNAISFVLFAMCKQEIVFGFVLKSRLLLLCREAAAVVPLHPATATQTKGWSSPLLQRSDHRAGEDVRDPKISVTSGEKASGQGAAAE